MAEMPPGVPHAHLNINGQRTAHRGALPFFSMSDVIRLAAVSVDPVASPVRVPPIKLERSGRGDKGFIFSSAAGLVCR